MVFSYSCGPDVTMITQISMAGPSDTNMVTGGSPDPGIQETLVATWAMDVNMGSSCGRTIDPDIALGSSLGPGGDHGPR